MPLNHGVVINYVPVTTSGISLSGATEPIAVVGVAQSGSAVPGALYLINSSSEGQAAFGSHAPGDTIPRTLDILYRYGCTNIVGLEVAKGADDTATATAIVAALDTLLTARSVLGISPRIILVPGFATTAVIDKAIAVALALKAIAILQFPTTDTVATVTTARNGSTGMGLKNPRLVVCFPSLKNAVTPTIIEPLATHVAGAIAYQSAQKGLGSSIDNFALQGVSGTDIPFSTSWIDENADSEKMYDLGVVTVNQRDGTWVIWGDKNASYPIDPGTSNSILAVRLRDVIAENLYAIAQPWLGSSGELGFALSLRSSMQSYLNSLMMGDVAALSGGTVELDMDASNFTPTEGEINWVYNVSMTAIGSAGLITLSVEVR